MFLFLFYSFFTFFKYYTLNFVQVVLEADFWLKIKQFNLFCSSFA